MEVNRIEEGILPLHSLQQIKKSVCTRYFDCVARPQHKFLCNKQYLEELKTITNNVKTFDKHGDAIFYLEKVMLPCQVITAGANGEEFSKKISLLPKVTYIHVFCGNVAFHSNWAQRIPNVASVVDSFNKLLGEILPRQRKMSFARTDLPLYGKIYNEADDNLSHPIFLYTNGLLKPWEQGKRNFLALAKEIYGNNKHIQDFEQNYKQYDMKSMLNWYTKESFLDKMIYNLFRINTQDSINCGIMVFRDLEKAIKEKYDQDSHKFSGLLYRGAYLPKDARNELERGKEIEMFGFLSTTKKKELALEFCRIGNVEEKVFITVIVPDVKGPKGFVELKEYSQFPAEEEVLFNIRSRFRVVESGMEDLEGVNCFHLVLLYGVEEFKKLMDKRPHIEVKIDKDQTILCEKCKGTRTISNNFGSVYMNLSNTNEFVCIECLEQYQVDKKSPLLCVYSSSEIFNPIIKGFVVSSQNLNVPFYGYSKCKQCNQKYRKCYRCLTCQRGMAVFCSKECVNQSNRCVNEGHLIILESYPFSFWAEGESQREIAKADAFLEAGENEMAIEQYEKCDKIIENYKKNQDQHMEAKAKVYGGLGKAYYALEKYEESINYYKIAVEINIEDNQMLIASFNEGLAIAESHLGEIKDALIHHSTALRAKKKHFGEMNLETAKSYVYIGDLFSRSEEYQKAIEQYEQALKIQKEKLGERHQDTANTYHVLGHAYAGLKNYSSATQYFTNAHEIRRNLLGDEHEQTIASKNALKMIKKR